MRTKRHLLAQIRKGKVSVEAVYSTTMYRVALPDDPDPNCGVWIALEDRRYIVADYNAVHARINGRELRLTHAETDAVAWLVAATMRLRSAPRMSA